MTFKPPDKMTPTEMCIYVDEHMYKEDCDEEKIYTCIYCIFNMLAHIHKYFKKEKDYDEYSIYGASKVFFRIRNPKQYQLKEDGTPKLPKIKSILNYLKTVCYPIKVDYEQEYFSQCLSEPIDNIRYYYSFNNSINHSIDMISHSEFEICLGDLIKTTKAFVQHIPHKRNSEEFDNIYLSLILSFLNSITPRNSSKENMVDFDEGTLYYKEEVVDRIYRKEKENAVILYHLSESYRDYVEVLLRRLKHYIATDLNHILHQYILSDDILKDIITEGVSIQNYGEHKEECQ